MSAKGNTPNNKTQELISIIIPVYNAQKYLSDCLDSVLQQTYKNWEAILVNDGSTDYSVDILRKFAAKDQRFIVIDQKNSGVSSARNVALKNIHGEYVAFLDSDDMLYPQFLEFMLQSIKQTNADLAWCFFDKIAETKNSENLPIFEKFKFSTHQNLIKHFLTSGKPKLKITVWANFIRDIACKISIFPKNLNRWPKISIIHFMLLNG